VDATLVEPRLLGVVENLFQTGNGATLFLRGGAVPEG